jgi:sarcosine oxidase subunit beta
MDVIVIGGGIVGLSAAHYLAERGADVTLYEKRSLGTGSTARAAGGIRSQFSTAVNVELSLASKAVWDEFESTFGVDIDRRKNGYLFLARTEATAERFRDQVRMQRDRGAASEFITPEDATEYCPGLDPDQFVAATYNPDDGIADPNLAVQGYAGAAREGGVDIQTGTAVTALHREDGRVVGVDIEVDGTTERHDADAVVNAAGAWAAHIGAMAGVELPISPRRRHVALVGGHFGAADPEMDPDRFDEDMDIDWAATAVEMAAEYTEYFGPETRIRRGWAGLYAVTPDHHPIIEETLPGFVTAAGFSGHGFQHAPATGQIVAELLVDGEPGLVDVSMLDSERFERGDGLTEQNVA